MAEPSSAPAHLSALRPSRVFRLLDLPAEMRNRIYEESLTHHRNENRTANTALLRVCKQIHNEAKGIFEARSTLSFRVVTVQDVDEAGLTTDDYVLKVSGDLHLNHDINVRLDAFCDKIPETLRDAKNIHIVLHMPGTDGFIQDYWGMHCFIYGLVDFLSVAVGRSSTRLRVTTQDPKESNHDTQDGQKVVLYPLTKLPADFDISLDGAYLEQQFHATRKITGTGSSTIIPELHRLRPIIKKLAASASFAMLSGITELDAVHNVARRCAIRLEEVDMSVMDGWMLPRLERKCVLGLMVVKLWLTVRQKGSVAQEDLDNITDYTNGIVEEMPDHLKIWDFN